MAEVSTDEGGCAIVWLRDDLRLADNPALSAAAASALPILCLYVLDETSEGPRPLGGAARWFLHGALAALSDALASRGGELAIFQGSAEKRILDCVADLDARAVFWNRRYDGASRRIDAAIEMKLRQSGIEVETFNANLLHDPEALTSASGKPFQVFTPFWRSLVAKGEPSPPLPTPRRIGFREMPPALREKTITLGALALEPKAPDWAAGLRETWPRGEAAAHKRLAEFVANGFANYAKERGRPDLASTSRLSPDLRFGAISPRQIWHEVLKSNCPSRDENRVKFFSELGWREFSYHLLHHHPDMAKRNLRDGLDAFPWRNDRAGLRAWQRGLTGYPIVDAGMRQLWRTGSMHNRVRMIAASFLIKDLLIDWREGERWFWDTLVDADPANNPSSWQWVAGTGTDAAPFFRIFNPVLQGEKFDPDGSYVRRYVPELGFLPAHLIHAPWTATALELAAAGIKLGETYPARIVEHDLARKRALVAWKGRED